MHVGLADTSWIRNYAIFKGRLKNLKQLAITKRQRQVEADFVLSETRQAGIDGLKRKGGCPKSVCPDVPPQIP